MVSIGRLFNLCMVAATLIVMVVAGQSLTRELVDYRARARAIDAERALEASLGLMEKLAVLRGPTARLLASPHAATAEDLGPMLAVRGAVGAAMAELRTRIAALIDSDGTPNGGQVRVISETADSIDRARLARAAVIDASLARPLAERDAGMMNGYAVDDFALERQFVQLLNALQARVAVGAAESASVIQIARYAADLRELAGIQAQVITPAQVERRPFTSGELEKAGLIQGEINRLRSQVEAAIGYVGDPPGLVAAWRLAEDGYFRRGRDAIDQVLKAGAVDGNYPMPLPDFIPLVAVQLRSLIALRDGASGAAVELASQGRNLAWSRVVASAAELGGVVALVIGLTLLFRRRVVIPLLRLACKIEGLAAGKRDIVIDMTERNDEVGGLARASQVFHAALLEREQLAEKLQWEMIERNNAEAARADLQDQLLRAKKMEAIGTMAGGVAHELNNLLQPILMLGELLVDQFAEEDQDCRDDMAMIIDHAERARYIVSSIVTFARKESATIGTLDVAHEMRAVDAMLRKLVPSTVRIEQQIAPETCLVLANRTELLQVVTNLIMNASHAMNQLGSVRIALGHRQLGESEATQLQVRPGDYADLSIADTGSGIEPGLLDRIFEPFFTTKPAGQGTGLGLSVVYGIVHAWKGAMRVESEVGRGTTFSILVPIHSS